MALEFGFPNVEELKERVTWRQFLTWRAFDNLSPIDSRVRMDAAIARLAVVALRQLGNKEVTAEDFLPFPRKDARSNRRPSKRAVAGLDPEVFKALGA